MAWKGLKIEIYCKLEKCWAWPKVYVGCKYTHLICILWRQQGGGPLEFHNIQEIVDIKLMFELICMFVCFLSFYPHSKWSEKRKSTIKQEKVLNYYYITILYSSKTHVNSSLLFDQFISNIQEIIDIEWMFELICMFVCFLSFYPHSKWSGKWSGKEEINSKMGESSKLLLYYSAIVKYMCLFCDQLTSYLPIQVSKWHSL